jgi:hypothetical protein
VHPSKNSNVMKETATFRVTGGSGIHDRATGGGKFSFSISENPQTGTGTVSAALTY